jgi:pilus assembly protein CpaE
MSTFLNVPDPRSLKALYVVLIVPDNERRLALAKVLAGPRAVIARQFAEYPGSNALAEMVALDCDVVVVDLDADLERALSLIENICSLNGSVTVMAHSSKTESSLLVRAMRAGARELLVAPVLPGAMDEALVRASARRQARDQRRTAGKVLVFAGTKGGVGVTMLAMNFAIALTRESGAKVVVLDMDYQLGEIALGLGLNARFSIVDALRNTVRLDADFLSTMLAKHSSGLAVLASPDEYGCFPLLDQDAEKLFRVLRDEFDYVVVDMGSCSGLIQETLFGLAETVYLVTEMNVPALRNGQRMIRYLSATAGTGRIDVILNRFNSRKVDIDEASAAKALTRPVDWRIPNEYMAVRRAQNSGVPLAMENTAITRVLVQMARKACGASATAAKKKRKGAGLFELTTPATMPGFGEPERA